MSKKKEKTATEVKLREVIPNINLQKHCPQKIFYVLFLNESDDTTKEIKNKLVEVSREYEDLSHLTFISYDEVIDLMQTCDESDLPPQITSILKEISRRAKSDPFIHFHDMAKLMKLKLVDVMYKDYMKEVTKMQQRKQLEIDLKALTECGLGKREAKVNDAKKPETREGTRTSLHRRETSTKNSLVSKLVDVQNTGITLIPIDTESNIVFDDDVSHHIAFYIFHGFYHKPKLLEKLIVNYKVDIRAIIKITNPSSDKSINAEESSTTYSEYWDEIYQYFDGPERRTFLENTCLMNFAPVGNDFKLVFEELLHILRGIPDIQLQHVNYIRHLDILRVKGSYSHYPLEVLATYNNFFKRIPLELVNVPIIFDTLLQQVCTSVEEVSILSNNTSQHSCLESKSSEKHKCIDPCSIEAFLKHKIKLATEPLNSRKLIASFRTHEEDELNIILNSYKTYGVIAYDITLKMLKNLKLFRDFERFEEDYTEVIHKHDRDPSTKTVIKDEDMILHFLYLFLFSLYDHKNILPKSVEADTISNLETYNRSDFIKICQTVVLPSQTTIDVDEPLEKNLYNTAAVHYLWKEKLQSSVLLQEIQKASDDYLYCDQRYSVETNNLLLQFSDCLDQFGVNTRIYEEYLRTPVCLRDFCKYTISDEREWLEKNKPPKFVRKSAIKEYCQGVKKVTNLDLFPEYQHLLQTETKKEPEIQWSHMTDSKKEELTFEQFIEELKNYPPNSEIVQECLKSNKEKTKYVYDLGTRYFQIKGAKTSFCSHDNVKLITDNTRMLNEYPQCSIGLYCKNNSLILHSSKFYLKEDYDFHMNLSDGTVVSFIIFKPRKIKVSSQTKYFDAETNKVSSLKTETTKTSLETLPEEIKILSVDKDYFESLGKTGLLNEQYGDAKEIIFKRPETIFESFKEATVSSIPIYKVTNNLTHIKKVKSEFEIPIAHILKQVLHTAAHKDETDAFTKRYLPLKEKKYLEVKYTLDTRIALPNGLYITFYPSKSFKDFVEVKQEFLCCNSTTENEEFRLFTRMGYILIKKIDGTITVLRSNGDIVDHEKLDADFENIHKWRLKQCHCRTIEDYKKRVGKIFKKENEEAPDVAISRRAGIRTRRGFIVNPDVTSLLDDQKVPYLKTTLLKFDGNRICLESEKIRVKKVTYITCEHNFTEQELNYERGDGFKSSFDKNGRQVVEFIDGTRITSTAQIAKDLVDGYVYISLEFKYEHPSYASVAYGSDNSLDILLNNNVVISKENADRVTLKIDEDITTTVDKEKVVFEKRCSTCNSKYLCDINVKPLGTGDLNFSDNFVHVRDSYNKHFYVDFVGNCQRNEDYIRGQFNENKCNHYNNMVYKKLFVVNRDFTGETFWTDNMVISKTKETNQDENSCLKKYDDAQNPKVHVYKFIRKIYDQYCNRYNNVNRCNISNFQVAKDPVYSTFRVVKRMLKAETIQIFLNDLNYLLTKTNINAKFLGVVDGMIEQHEMGTEKESLLPVVKVESIVDEVKIYKCKCVKQRITMSEKIARWRAECEKYRSLMRGGRVPCYFESDFYRVTDRI